MLFNSPEFLVFFPVAVIVYFALPHRARLYWLLGTSCAFYMAFIPVYILILAAMIVIDYLAGLALERAPASRKRPLLLVSIIANVGILFVFKYFNFFNANLAALADFIGWNYSIRALSIALPIGLSFHTFQSLSYTIEVYRGRQKAERSFLAYAVYVMFWPQLVAGPIERPQNMLHQFHKPQRLDYERITDGLRLMAWGFFKKVVIADRLAVAVDQVYNSPTDHTGVSLILATYFFAFQIYCDFSGYSDIAIGAARVMGYNLMENFRQPYLSRTVGEFWRRWHISLSTWFRDYLYIPLGGNRVSRWRWYYNLMLVFLVSGLWHGANWTFVVWGALHGLYLVVETWLEPVRARIGKIFGPGRLPWLSAGLQLLVTFHLVTFAWIFFRAATISDAWYIVTHLFSGLDLASGYGLGLGLYEFAVVIAAILVMETVHVMQARGINANFLVRQPLWVRWAAYYILVFSILIFGKFGLTEFIYFQF